jgi:polynucleotide 5'-hydroxyl-kinase GRC3/NOL9
MSEDWADTIAARVVGTSPPPTGRFLLLGAADTGKTTLLLALANRLAQSRPVALVDADIGQSHIGPPTTVGWTVIDKACSPAALGWEAITPGGGGATGGIAFVGDITPVGHLLQLTAALILCVEQAAQAADVVLIDTPGLVTGGAACTLWWTVQQLLRPQRILAVQRENELGEVLKGLHPGMSAIELIQAPPQLRRKSPEARQEHRRRLFGDYFRNAAVHTLDLGALAVRTTRGMTPGNTIGRLVGLADGTGQDVAIGVIEQWRQEKAKGTIRAPQLDVQRVRCLTIGDARIAEPFGWS